MNWHRENITDFGQSWISLNFKPRKNLADVVLKDIGFFLFWNVRIIYIAFGIVEVMAGFRINTLNSTNHLGGEEDILVIDNIEQHVDTFLVINAGIEIHIVHQ